jgi:hypothetical protein
LRRSLFVGAVDGSLWERTLIGGNFQWIAHGTPPGTCVTGEPMTDPALVPPVSPLRIFAAAASGALVERIIDDPSGVTWIDHGRPSTASGPVNVGSGGVVVADLARGSVHVFVSQGGALHRLDIATLGQAGSWSMLPAPPPSTPAEDTWISSRPGCATLVASSTTVFAHFFVVATRRLSAGGLSGQPTDEVFHCRSNLRVAGNLAYVDLLGAPGRPPLLGTNYYVVAAVRGHAAPLNRVYASSWPSQGGAESLDEWTVPPAPSGTAGLGLPPAMPAPCRDAPPVMMACGGPRQFGVGSA